MLELDDRGEALCAEFSLCSEEYFMLMMCAGQQTKFSPDQLLHSVVTFWLAGAERSDVLAAAPQLDAALRSLLARGLLQIVDDTVRREILARLANDPAIGPRLMSFAGTRVTNGATEVTLQGVRIVERAMEVCYNWPEGEFAFVAGIPDEGFAVDTIHALATNEPLCGKGLADAMVSRQIPDSTRTILKREGPVPVGPIRDYWWRSSRLGWRATLTYVVSHPT